MAGRRRAVESAGGQSGSLADVRRIWQYHCYLQVMSQLFKENRLAKGTFVGLGRKLNLHNITCPAYLLAGANDDITTSEQILDAAKYLGTPKDRVVQKIVPVISDCSWVRTR